MCGRYVLAMRPSVVRQRLADHDMPADDAPSDEDSQLRQSYNFAPGYHGLIYRAATNDRGTDSTPLDDANNDNNGEPSPKKVTLSSPTKATLDGRATHETKYKLQSAKWGLIPFWTKRPPDYGSMMRTINCRDDSLAQNGGMWNTMKQRKRCIVVAEGFYEWLKKDGGKQKVPHFVKRKDGGLMLLAGLWDCVQYEDQQKEDGKDEAEKLYTYTIITTDSNKQLNFLHDRMPVILEPASDELWTWLDPSNNGWNKELQSILQPYKGELECYPVDQAVGKVGNNSPNFVIPVDSKDNKKNIANFFGNAAKKQSPKKQQPSTDPDIKTEEADETRATSSKIEDPESNAPLPVPTETQASQSDGLSQAIANDTASVPDNAMIEVADNITERKIERDVEELPDEVLEEVERTTPAKRKASFTETSSRDAKTAKKDMAASTPTKTRSATSNVRKTPNKSGGTAGTEKNTKITSFFGK